MIKIALSICRGRIAPVFDVSRQILVAEIQQRAVISQAVQDMTTDDPVGKAGALVQWGVQTLICGAISRPLASLLAAYGIRTIGFTAGAVEEVMHAFMERALPCPTLAMPGCCPERRSKGACGQGRPDASRRRTNRGAGRAGADALGETKNPERGSQ